MNETKFMFNMNKQLLFLLSIVFSFTVLTSYAKKTDPQAAQWRYDIECAGNGQEGNYLVKIWVYNSKAIVPAEEVKKSAIHGIIFRGYSKNNICDTEQKPLIRDASIQYEKQDFFNVFFGKEQSFLKYASMVSPTPEVIKISKKEFKVGYVVSISKDLLRKDLEKSGVIRGLSSGF